LFLYTDPDLSDVLDVVYVVEGAARPHHVLLDRLPEVVPLLPCTTDHTDKKEYKIFLVYEEIQMGSGLYMRKGFLIYVCEMRKFFPIYEEAVSHI
jgi:hypothetical protein